LGRSFAALKRSYEYSTVPEKFAIGDDAHPDTIRQSPVTDFDVPGSAEVVLAVHVPVPIVFLGVGFHDRVEAADPPAGLQHVRHPGGDVGGQLRLVGRKVDDERPQPVALRWPPNKPP
jgi:hypothetical protein